VTEVIIADAGSTDATAEVADLAGCRYLVSEAPVGARLKRAAEEARASWLLFLRPGLVPQPGWIEAVEGFIGSGAGKERAAVFRHAGAFDDHGLRAAFSLLRRAVFGGPPAPDQGLLIARPLYARIGGHDGGDDAETALVRRIGRRRIALLTAATRRARADT
jgi:glycosyltransferase involved in cell wall biosynthesis